MAELFRLYAAPELFIDGEYKGKLKGVNFTATSADNTSTVEWFARNRGQLEKAFSKIMHPDIARLMHLSLTQGHGVEFPGVYQEFEFARGFMFEWSPIYFVTPPTYAYGG